jgi:hypothetical protein
MKHNNKGLSSSKDKINFDEENKVCTELDTIKEEREGSLDQKLLGGKIEPVLEPEVVK